MDFLEDDFELSGVALTLANSSVITEPELLTQPFKSDPLMVESNDVELETQATAFPFESNDTPPLTVPSGLGINPSTCKPTSMSPVPW